MKTTDRQQYTLSDAQCDIEQIDAYARAGYLSSVHAHELRESVKKRAGLPPLHELLAELQCEFVEAE